MIIDFHTHVADLRDSDKSDLIPLTFESLIRSMDDEGIDRSVVLPVNASPEILQPPLFFSPGLDIISHLKDASRYSNRLILFGNLDPRMGGAGNLEKHQLDNRPVTDFSPYLERFKDMGCVGIGEVTANLPLDDPRVINMFRQCGEWDMPVLFHCTGPGMGVYGLSDNIGLPRLENLLIEAPDTIVIGHAPGFWSEISGDISTGDKFIYPEEPIEREGSLQRLLRTYPNLYADISGTSGFNAITRDKDYGVKFLLEFQDRILFGTDIWLEGVEGKTPHLSYLRNLLSAQLISREIFDKITGDNALKILSLYDH